MMLPKQNARPGFRRRALAGASPLLLLCAFAARGEETSPAAPPAPVSTSAPAPAAVPAAPADPWQPPDGKWLTDETGQEYYILEVPRLEGHYVFVDEKHVRLRGGMTLTLDHYDEKNFYAKIIRVRPEDNPPVRRPGPTAEELAEAAKGYEVALPEVQKVAWQAFDAGLPRNGQWRNGFDIADMNGDGALDIVHGPARKGDFRPKVFLGDRAGSWKEWPLQVEARSLDYGDVAVADFDGDGHLDMALGMHLLGITVLRGDGAGRFREAGEGLDYAGPAAGVEGSQSFSSRALMVVDWNADKKPDLLALGEGMRMNIGNEGAQVGGSSSFGPVVYLNGGAQKPWRRKDEGTTSEKPAGGSLVTGDFDADGRLDFAVVNSGLNTRDLLMLGEKDGGWRAVELPLRPRGFAEALATGDFDRDGKADLAIAWTNFEHNVRRSGIDVLLNRSGRSGRGASPVKAGPTQKSAAGASADTLPRWQSVPLAAGEGASRYQAIAAGDIDGDGRSDLVTTGHGGEVDFFFGDGAGGFSHQAGPTAEPNAACQGYDVRLVDLDGDRQVELVANFAGEGPNAMQTAFQLKGFICRTGGSLRAWKLVASAP